LKVPLDVADADVLSTFLKQTVLSIEVALTDTPRQSDPGVKREKFEGSVVHAATVDSESQLLKEQLDGQWFVVWNLTVPVS
jgi:hypothetical protein